MFCIAICDDEEYFCIKEKELVAGFMDCKGYPYRIDIFSSGRELLDSPDLISQYDVIFLDVNMRELDGIETAKEIRKITRETYIVFVTAFITYAPEGYKVDAIRYLLKDDACLEKAVVECLETIVYKMNYEEQKHVFEFQEGKLEIFFEDILYIESNLHKLIFHLTGNRKTKYTMYAKLDDMDELLRDAGFCRLHKSYLVNLRYVESIKRYQAELSDGNSLGISKSRYPEAKNAWVCYRGEI